MKKKYMVGIVLVVILVAGYMVFAPKRGRRPVNRTGPPKVVIIGFDGADAKLTERYMNEGKLPNLAKLARKGTFRHFGTTNPPESPVAWATFSTGMLPGKHSIFDFLKRDLETYYPDIAGIRKEPPKFKWGLIPIKKPILENTRGGESFWTTASKKGVKSLVLKVPNNFPPEEMENGDVLAGLGVPDLRGTQGTFFYFSTELTKADAENTEFGGKLVAINVVDGKVETKIEGPRDPTIEDDFVRIKVPFEFQVDRTAKKITFEFQGQKGEARLREWTDWYKIKFPVTFYFKLHGIMRMYLIEVEPEVKLYIAPINFDPTMPPFPISHPKDFARELTEDYGYYKTLGWMEETWGLTEERIDEAAFLADMNKFMDQTLEMTLGELKRTDADLFISVFTETDRIQHMFYRLIDPEHARYEPELVAKYGNAIENIYKRMDHAVGEILKVIGPDTTLFVISDHGFHSWRKGLNINTWLVRNGFMMLNGQENKVKVLDDLFTQKRFFDNVDWTRTKAYSLGLGQIYLNLRGREKYGIVSPGLDQEEVKAGIVNILRGFKDPDDGNVVVKEVYKAQDIYGKGKYFSEAPDLQVAFADGYRVSWQTCLGGVPPELMEINDKKWSGDHCSAIAEDTKGIFFSNKKVEDEDPTIFDIAPTTLNIFNVPIPKEYDGKVLKVEK